jgi:biopolymer transport protein ExbD
MEKKKLFSKQKKKTDPGMNLQITSMADIFTILLVFLLKGLASDAIQISPANNTRLPATVRSHPLQERALQIEITPTEILVEKESIGDIQALSQLDQRLSEQRERNRVISEANPSVKNDHRAILIADEKTSYDRIRSVLKSLSKNGYSEIHFAVLEK